MFSLDFPCHRSPTNNCGLTHLKKNIVFIINEQFSMYKQLNFCLRLFLDLVYNNPPAFLKMSRSYMYKKRMLLSQVYDIKPGHKNSAVL